MGEKKATAFEGEVIFVKIQFYPAKESKQLISFSGFSLSFPVFSVKMEGVYSPPHQENQIFCYVCFGISYSLAHKQAIECKGSKSGRLTSPSEIG